MYTLHVFADRALVKCSLRGRIDADELRLFTRELSDVLAAGGVVTNVFFDLCHFNPATREVDQLLEDLRGRASDDGWRIAELVDNQLMAAQLNRLAAEQHRDERLQRFWEEGPALVWLGG